MNGKTSELQKSLTSQPFCEPVATELNSLILYSSSSSLLTSEVRIAAADELICKCTCYAVASTDRQIQTIRTDTYVRERSADCTWLGRPYITTESSAAAATVRSRAPTSFNRRHTSTKLTDACVRIDPRRK